MGMPCAVSMLTAQGSQLRAHSSGLTAQEQCSTDCLDHVASKLSSIFLLIGEIPYRLLLNANGVYTLCTGHVRCQCISRVSLPHVSQGFTDGL